MSSRHVIPRADLVEHVSNDGCVCGPITKAAKGLDGSVHWIMVHSSLDGREKQESACDE